MSLRDQLLKAGLVSKDKATAVAKSKKQQQHNIHKDKHIKAQVDAQEQQRQIEFKAFDEVKRLDDLEKNRLIQAKKHKKESRIAARRIIDEKRVNDKTAEDRFNFSADGKKIRFVLVTAKQRQLIGLGELAICRNDRDGFDYPLIPKEYISKLQEFEALDDKKWILLFNDPNEEDIPSEAQDEWAAWDAFEAESKKGSS
ncbi:hypothetical protein AwWohl_09000 [Gammaproteobacteria bacterium]|nr:hypothetical protein AwWohl_09000 [Gammaproteobacteria bacterium]